MDKDVLYLVDTTNLLYQFWYKYTKDICNEQGECINVLHGLQIFVQNLLKNENPRCVVFVFDQRLKTSKRKQLSAAYKAHRSKTPPALEQQFRWCEKWIQSLKLPYASSDSVEADDVIATLIRLHREKFKSVVIISSDKDLAQLIEKNDLLWDIQKNQYYSEKLIIKKQGVKPQQIADQLALAGDKSDNIKGVPNVGLHTAAKLLKRFENIAELVEYKEEIKKMKFRNSIIVYQKIAENIDQLLLNIQLTQLDDNVPDIEKISICRY